MYTKRSRIISWKSKCKKRYTYFDGEVKRFFLTAKFQGWSKGQVQSFLLSCGDVESNPGPVRDVDISHGRFHCGARKYFPGGGLLPPHLKIIQYNIRSWKKNKTEFLSRLNTVKPHVIMIQESWLTPKDAVVKVKGYHVERLDRVQPRQGDVARGDGLLTLIRTSDDCGDNLQIQPLQRLTLTEDSTTEILQVKVIWRGSAVVISNVCIPPIGATRGEERVQKFEADHAFSSCLNSDVLSQHIIAGDFSCHHEF